MHIKKVLIKNFQSHENTEVDLENGINVFVGPSDSGKSAILRALRWNLMNQPSGGEFVKEGSREATVIVEWSDGHAVRRMRNKTGSKNTYTLLKDGVVLEEYTGFGSKVPPPILEITGIDPELRFNFASQLEAPFLLSETPKVRAETIGNLEELGRIDVELTSVNEDINLKRKEQKNQYAKLQQRELEKNALALEVVANESKELTLKQLKENFLKERALLDEFEKRAPRLVEVQREIKGLSEQLNRSKRILAAWNENAPEELSAVIRLETVVERTKEVRNELKEIEYLADDTYEKLVTLTEKTASLVDEFKGLIQLQNRAQSTNGEKKQLESSYSKRVAGIEFAHVDEHVNEFSELLKRYKNVKQLEEEQAQTKHSIQEYASEVERLLNEFVEALQHTEVCPTCYQDTVHVDKHTIETSL